MYKYNLYQKHINTINILGKNRRGLKKKESNQGKSGKICLRLSSSGARL